MEEIILLVVLAVYFISISILLYTNYLLEKEYQNYQKKLLDLINDLEREANEREWKK